MAEADLVLAADVGTTNVKAAVVDRDGNILHLATRKMEVDHDDSGKAEHDPHFLYEAFIDSMREASAAYRDRIALVVPATYQMGLIAVDQASEPLTGMLTLLDTRARTTHTDLLRAVDSQILYRHTGCPPLFHYPLAKLFWIKHAHPELYARTRCFLSCKDYLILKLLGVTVTDTSVSSTTQYMNIDALIWDQEVLNDVDVPSDLLPKVLSPETILTDNLDNARRALDLPNLQGALLGAYDGGAVGIGLGCFNANTAVMNFGTSAMLRYRAPNSALSRPPDSDIQSSYLALGSWIPGGAVNNAGAVLNWLRDNIFQSSYDTLDQVASSEVSSKNLFFLPYLSGERSVSVGPNGSGCYFGLRTYHQQGHMVRAAMEGVAFTLRGVQESLKANGINPTKIRVGSGGASSKIWMEIVASVLEKPLETTVSPQPGLLGSAMLGYVALGSYEHIEAATEAMVRADHTIEPHSARVAEYDEAYQFFGFLTDQLQAAFAQHEQLQG